MGIPIPDDERQRLTGLTSANMRWVVSSRPDAELAAVAAEIEDEAIVESATPVYEPTAAADGGDGGEAAVPVFHELLVRVAPDREADVIDDLWGRLGLTHRRLASRLLSGDRHLFVTRALSPAEGLELVERVRGAQGVLAVEHDWSSSRPISMHSRPIRLATTTGRTSGISTVWGCATSGG